jgi:hyaluronan synthase
MIVPHGIAKKFKNLGSPESSDVPIRNSQSRIKCSSDVSASGEGCSRKADRAVWTVRSTVLACMISFEIFRIQQGWTFWDSYPVYAAVVPVITMFGLYARLKLFIYAWAFYKNPANDGRAAANSLVSVIIPIFNEKKLIPEVIDAIYHSTYQNIEVIAVDDGSNDGTSKILDDLTKRFPALTVIHKANEGIRKAIATGYYASKGEFIVLIDSDSIIDRNAILEFVKAFYAHPKATSLQGHVCLWNATASLVAKLEDCRFNTDYNIVKAYESSRKSVKCCTTALSAYRRDVIADCMNYWANIVTRSPAAIDAELTAHSLSRGWSEYVRSAVTHVTVVESFKMLIKQRIRWKVGYLRRNSQHYGRIFRGEKPWILIKHSADFVAPLTRLLIPFVIFFYEPFVLHSLWLPIAYMGGLLSLGLVWGLDMKLRDPGSKHWMYQPLLACLGTFVFPWLLIPAIFLYKKNSHLTR